MNYIIYLFSIIYIQQTTSQVLTVAGNNFIPNLYNPNKGGNVALGNGFGGSGALTNVGQTGNIAGNLENFYIPNNQGFVGNNLGNIAVAKNTGNFGNTGIANANAGNIGLANNANIGLTNNANIGLANNANIGLANNANIGISNANVGIINKNNVDTSNACITNPVPTYANIVKPPRDYGIEFDGDALEVNGAVQVSGRMPFNANVAVQGKIPAQGQGTVSYKCDKVNDDSC